MQNILLSVDIASLDWSRAQFALTAIYHWLFVPLTLGLALIMGIVETCYYRTGELFWKQTAMFWQRLFGVNFAMGVATGIILEFQFGTNWSNYSWLVGDIFGAPLAIEGILAFFMESTFVAVMFFGWKKVSKGFHLASTWLTGFGATISAWWILVANSWMQNPVGCTFNPDTMRNEMTSFFDVAFSPFAVNKFCHTISQSWLIGALFVIAVSCYYLLRNRERRLSIVSIKIASIVGLVASLLAIHTGDGSAYQVAQVQPMKLAAMEALYKGGGNQGLTIVAALNPFQQPDYTTDEEPPLCIKAPGFLSFLATRNFYGIVPGIQDIMKGGYPLPEGGVAMPVDAKMMNGRQAILALKEYRELNAQARTKTLTAQEKSRVAYLQQVLQSKIKYLGYGYVNDKAQLVPNIPICFYAFRIMVGLGCLFILFFAVTLFLVYRKDIARYRWLLISAMFLLPLGYVASECGWIVAEMGRQPWAIQDMLPTWMGLSDIESGQVMTTFFIFLIIFTTLLVAEIRILCQQIKKGPEMLES